MTLTILDNFILSFPKLFHLQFNPQINFILLFALFLLQRRDYQSLASCCQQNFIIYLFGLIFGPLHYSSIQNPHVFSLKLKKNHRYFDREEAFALNDEVAYFKLIEE